MKKIEINLYPHQPKEENKYIEAVEKYTPFALLAVIGFLVVNLILFSATASMSFPYRKLNLRWKQLQPKIKEVEKVRKELNSLVAEKKEYHRILEYKINAAHMLADVYASLPENIWLSKVSLNNNVLHISGCAVAWKKSALVSVDIFTKRLRKAKYFSSIFHKVDIKNSRRDIFNSREIMRFDIECRI